MQEQQNFEDLSPLPELPPLPGEQPFIPDVPPMPPAQPVQPVTPPSPPVAQAPMAARASYSPPSNSKSTLLGMVIGAVAVLIILGLAATFYYFTTHPIAPTPVAQDYVQTPPVPQEPQVIPTNIVQFAAPGELPTEQKVGNCWTSSLAEPYREDAWRCTAGNVIYDPCFETATPGIVYCQMNPTADASFTIRLTKALPAITVAATPNASWSWFVKLADEPGTICSPFTGTRPQVNGEAAHYGCRSEDKAQLVYIVGDLTVGKRWTATKVTIDKATQEVISSTVVDVDTVWQ